MTWLLVEDDNDIRNVVAVMMSVWGEKPLPFVDGNAAWTWLDSVDSGAFAGELPDLALLDIRMPGHTGDRVAARIRQTKQIKDIPIVLMTAFSLTDAEVKVMIEECGIDLLINKPLPDMDVFRATLYRVRDERRAVNAARLAQLQAQGASPAPATTQPPTPSAQPPAATPTPPAPQIAPATTPPPTPSAQPPAATPTPPVPQAAPATAQPPTPPAQPPAATPTPLVPQAAPATTPPPTPPAQPPAAAPAPPVPQTAPATTLPPTPSTPSQPAKATPPQSAQPPDKDQHKK